MGMKRIILVFGLMFVSICSINAANDKEPLDELLEILSNEWREMKEILGITEEGENSNPTTPSANTHTKESPTDNTPSDNSTTNDITSANDSFNNTVSGTTDNNRDEKVSTDKSTNNSSSNNNKNDASKTKIATNDNYTNATKPIKSKEKRVQLTKIHHLNKLLNDNTKQMNFKTFMNL